jgi:hypothetical protein
MASDFSCHRLHRPGEEPKSFSLRFLCSLLFNSTAEFRFKALNYLAG